MYDSTISFVVRSHLNVRIQINKRCLLLTTVILSRSANFEPLCSNFLTVLYANRRGHWLVFAACLLGLLAMLIQPLAGTIFGIAQVPILDGEIKKPVVS